MSLHIMVCPDCRGSGRSWNIINGAIKTFKERRIIDILTGVWKNKNEIRDSIYNTIRPFCDRCWRYRDADFYNNEGGFIVLSLKEQ